MNVEGGALEFESILNNDQLLSAIAEALRRVQGFSDATVAEGGRIDNTFQSIAQQIALSKDLIKQTEADIKALEKKITQMPPGRMQADLIAEANAARRALEEEKLILASLEEQARSTEQAHVSFRSQLRNVREELIRMEMAGQRDTDAFRELQEELGRLQDALDDAGQQARVLANDEAGFQGVITAMGGITGGASAAQGAMGLFSGENENLQKVMLKVQSLMAITIGLQQVSAALNKDSAFMLVTVAKAKTLLATATNGLSVALGISNVAAQALLATLTLGVSVAITAIIILWDRFSTAQAKAREETKKFGEKATESAYKVLTEFERLRQEWVKLGESLIEKEKYIRKNMDSFNSLGVAVNNVADAENVLINNREAFIESIIAKAKAAAAMELAAEKYKESMLKMQEADAMTDNVTHYTASGGSTYGGNSYGSSYTTENKKKTKRKKEAQELEDEARSWITKGIENTKEGNKLLEDANIRSTEALIEGSVAAIEAAISQKKKALSALTNPADYKAALKQIAKDEKALAAITGDKKNDSTKDPFTESLEKRKKQYQTFAQWVNSGDEILAKTARKEFDALLKEGDNYLDYLKKQREKLLLITNPNKTEKDKVRKLNSAIADETKKTVLSAFDEELQKELDNAQSIMAMLKVIEDRRKTLANDNSEIDNKKKETLDNAQKDVSKQAKAETETLLTDYSSYLARKIKMEQQYTEDMILLNNRLKEAKNDEEKQDIEGAITNRKVVYRVESQKSGDENYDALLADYGAFEQKKTVITNDYEEKRRVAKLHGDKTLLTRLLEEEQKALSKLATEELTESNIWKNLFGNLDELTAAQIDTLITEIETRFDSLSVKFDPVDLNTIRTKLNEARMILIQDNPFKQVGVAIKTIFNDGADGSKDSANKIKTNWKNLSQAVEGSFKFVEDAINSCDFLKDVIGDVGATAISSLTTIATVSIAVTTAIKTAEKASVILAIIQAALAVVQAIAGFMKSMFAANDKDIARQIARHREAVKLLENAYKDLERSIQKALGNDTYKSQQQAIANLQEQRLKLLEMKRLEEDKKKTDSGKVQEYEQAYKEAGQRIEDIFSEIANSLTQTTAKDLAEDLADAICGAFAKGEDAAQKFDEVARNVMQNAVKNALKLQFLEQPLQEAIKGLENDMGHWGQSDDTKRKIKELEQQIIFLNDTNFIGMNNRKIQELQDTIKIYQDVKDEFKFDGIDEAEQQKFKDKVAAIGGNFTEAMKMYKDLFKDLESEEFDTSLTGAVKGVSEETASLVAGQINAVRINQIEALEVMRQQLIALNLIAANTSHNVHLMKLTEIVDLLKGNSVDPLRSQGLS